jgi:predicted aspartyl protease
MTEFGGNIPTPIQTRGVFIDIVLKHPERPLAGIKATGLIDTGADFVLCSQSFARQLGLRRTNKDFVEGIGGEKVEAEIYSGSLGVEKLGFERRMAIYAVPWGPLSHSVLLGRSFLKYFVFKYDGPSDVFHFSTPLYGGYHPPDEDG